MIFLWDFNPDACANFGASVPCLSVGQILLIVGWSIILAFVLCLLVFLGYFVYEKITDRRVFRP